MKLVPKDVFAMLIASFLAHLSTHGRAVLSVKSAGQLTPGGFNCRCRFCKAALYTLNTSSKARGLRVVQCFLRGYRAVRYTENCQFLSAAVLFISNSASHLRWFAEPTKKILSSDWLDRPKACFEAMLRSRVPSNESREKISRSNLCFLIGLDRLQGCRCRCNEVASKLQRSHSWIASRNWIRSV